MKKSYPAPSKAPGFQQVQRMFIFNRLHNFRKCIMLCVILLIAMVIYTFPYKSLIKIREPGLAIQYRPCKIHDLDPWDKVMAYYLKDPPPAYCEKAGNSLMFVDDNGMLRYNDSAIKLYSLTSLTCVYHVITRKTDDFSISVGAAVEFIPPVFIEARVFKVVCHDSSSVKVYDFVHANVVWIESVERQKEIKRESDNEYSIIYFGLDSASRSHAIRKLPKSIKYLTETLGAYDFKGFMKVALNSFPNMIPLLTGTQDSGYHKENILKMHLDGIPFIWKEPEMTSYASLYAEDRPDISTFNYLHSGFRDSPVDYYFRVFALGMHTIEPTIMKPLGKSDWWCYGNKHHYLVQIDYLKQFLTKYSGRKRFAFFWNNQIGHETFTSLGNGDQPLYEFLQWMKSQGHLNRSIVIIGSDHGFRLGGASTTYTGRLENNMPMMMVYLPDSLKKKFPWIPENMKQNTDKLISPFDIYATMLDIIKGNYEETLCKEVSRELTHRSLFGKIPKSRSCADAGIGEQYCSCYDAQTASVSNPLVHKIGAKIVSHINAMLSNHKSVCRTLELKNITEVKVIYAAEGDWDNEPIHRKPGFFKRLLGDTETDESGRYTLMLYTSPNEGLIEGMVDYEKKATTGEKYTKTIGEKNKMTVIGNPVRSNRYGNQSHCIDDPTLRQYCLCFDIPL
ncbi:uncharacterized protein LOC127863362 [Dreissena polymorpha]|uniref:Uncharacterized protein n=1 Tax=Dreissena polymorpha TaxID=45954 RepID=A0A9D3Y3P6_DREPO|nr:uncharacterized protein LOC127863362 [Dreissena polymorpha]XP_052258802.1 uncharacterized protein LOC127863362 [Dreissena polymorpha]XP_052258804.1 uncharacterized protein LOC127863362 [Dreissena polymorpha]KAH3692468.1 hypothetical protein DPMN_194309 [Dreissena polymorpha]